MTETVAEILDAYRSGATTPVDIVARSFAPHSCSRRSGDFHHAARGEGRPRRGASARAPRDTSLPLYGIPVAVKDNIDVAGLPTTAACPAFLYRPEKDATAVARLRAAGALILGKTNLDQFATGLVGVRSPYGIGAQSVRRQSSSPADRAPAPAWRSAPALRRWRSAPILRDRAACRPPTVILSGLKPSLGLVSTAGVVPACRTLDCVSVFALTVDDAMTALNVIAGPDDADPYSRPRPVHAVGPMPRRRQTRRSVCRPAFVFRRQNFGRRPTTRP